MNSQQTALIALRARTLTEHHGVASLDSRPCVFSFPNASLPRRRCRKGEKKARRVVDLSRAQLRRGKTLEGGSEDGDGGLCQAVCGSSFHIYNPDNFLKHKATPF